MSGAVPDGHLEPYARIGDHAWLRAQSLFVAEGRLVVQRVLSDSRYRVRSVLVTPAARRALASALDASDAPVLVRDRERLQSITGFDFHRGCLAIVERPAPLTWQEILMRRGVIVGLDGIGNPDNTGGVFRSASAFSAAGILAGPGASDPLYRKAVRTSMGAVLDVPWARVDRWEPVVAWCQRHSIRIVALTPSPEALPLSPGAFDGHLSVLLLLGAEGPGLAHELLDAADIRLRIPMTGRVDSLNVSVAAGIALSAAAQGMQSRE